MSSSANIKATLIVKNVGAFGDRMVAADIRAEARQKVVEKLSKLLEGNLDISIESVEALEIVIR